MHRRTLPTVVAGLALVGVFTGCGGSGEAPAADAAATGTPSPKPSVTTVEVPDVVGLTYEADGEPFWPSAEGFHAESVVLDTAECPEYDPDGDFPVRYTIDRTDPVAGTVVEDQRAVTVYATPDCAAFEAARVEAAQRAEEERVAAEAEAQRKAEEERLAAASVSQQNARRMAIDYLDYSAFSRSGLIDQLEYEGFSTEDATWGVDSIAVDWMEQAAQLAQDYLDYSSFSRSGLIDQLIYEGFSREQAEHGATAVGL